MDCVHVGRHAECVCLSLAWDAIESLGKLDPGQRTFQNFPLGYRRHQDMTADKERSKLSIATYVTQGMPLYSQHNKK